MSDSSSENDFEDPFLLKVKFKELGSKAAAEKLPLTKVLEENDKSESLGKFLWTPEEYDKHIQKG